MYRPANAWIIVTELTVLCIKHWGVGTGLALFRGHYSFGADAIPLPILQTQDLRLRERK